MQSLDKKICLRYRPIVWIVASVGFGLMMVFASWYGKAPSDWFRLLVAGFGLIFVALGLLCLPTVTLWKCCDTNEFHIEWDYRISSWRRSWVIPLEEIQAVGYGIHYRTVYRNGKTTRLRKTYLAVLTSSRGRFELFPDSHAPLEPQIYGKKLADCLGVPCIELPEPDPDPV